MYRKRRPEDVAHANSSSNATLSSTPAQSVSPLLPSTQRPTYGSVSSVDDSDNSTVSAATTVPQSDEIGGGAVGHGFRGVGEQSTTAAAVESYKQVGEL